MDVRALATRAMTLLLWASAFAGIRAGLEAYSPGQLALLRFLAASAVLAVYALATRMRLPSRRDLLPIAGAGILGIAAYHTALNYGEISVTAGAASLLIATTPIITSLLAILLLGERMSGRGWLAIAISFAGSALIAVGEGKGFAFEPSAILLLMAAALQALFFVVQKPYLTSYSPLELTSYTIWAGTLVLLVFLPGLPQAVQAAPESATLAVIYLGVFPAAIANVTWAHTLSKAPASNATAQLYLVPALAILIAWGWLGEIPTALSLVGGGITLSGILLLNLQGK